VSVGKIYKRDQKTSVSFSLLFCLVVVVVVVVVVVIIYRDNNNTTTTTQYNILESHPTGPFYFIFYVSMGMLNVRVNEKRREKCEMNKNFF
jgi:peptidoglycan biosynthesis protein MviN/MurJ (putative lipid II flippase)